MEVQPLSFLIQAVGGAEWLTFYVMSCCYYYRCLISVCRLFDMEFKSNIFHFPRAAFVQLVSELNLKLTKSDIILYTDHFTAGEYITM